VLLRRWLPSQEVRWWRRKRCGSFGKETKHSPKLRLSFTTLCTAYDGVWPAFRQSWSTRLCSCTAKTISRFPWRTLVNISRRRDNLELPLGAITRRFIHQRGRDALDAVKQRFPTRRDIRTKLKPLGDQMAFGLGIPALAKKGAGSHANNQCFHESSSLYSMLRDIHEHLNASPVLPELGRFSLSDCPSVRYSAIFPWFPRACMSRTLSLMTHPNACRATSEYSRPYPHRTSRKDHAIRSRYAALPVRCPASGRGETEAAAQCRIHQ
jgi:hypothetical protein